MKILAIGDPHGKIPQIKNLVKKEKPDIILCTGDFADDLGITKKIFKNWGKPWWIKIGKKKGKEIVKKSEQKGRKVLEYLSKLRIPVYYIAGNHEKRNSFGKRVLKNKNLNFRHNQKKKIKDYNFIFHGGYMEPKIFMNPRTLGITKEETLERKKRHDSEKKKIENLFKKSKGKKIFVTHFPPYLHFDKIKNKQSPMDGKHIGVKAYSDLIKKYKPELYICGHMHENPGIKKIGKTTAVCLGLSHKYVYILDIDGKTEIKRKKISK